MTRGAKCSLRPNVFKTVQASRLKDQGRPALLSRYHKVSRTLKPFPGR